MNYIKILVLSLACLGLILTPVFFFESTSQTTTSTVATPNWQNVLEYARAHLPMEGKLMMKSDGFGYLKVDDEYIHTLFPMLGLKKEGFQEPPYFRTRKAPGAHISVFYEKEKVIPEEVGRYFRFELKQIVIIKPSENTSYVVLQVKSPELEKLREKYGLSPKLFGHDFHISLAKKTRHFISRDF